MRGGFGVLSLMMVVGGLLFIGLVLIGVVLIGVVWVLGVWLITWWYGYVPTRDRS